MPFDELLRKLGLQKSVPTMGEVKTTPEERFLNARPVIEQGYGQQQDTYDRLKESNHNLAEMGINFGNPTQQEMDLNDSLTDGSMMGMGSISSGGKAAITALQRLRAFKSGSNVLEAENAAQAFGKIPRNPLGRVLIDTGEQVRPNLGNIKIKF